MKTYKILFLNSSINFSRYAKRINLLSRNGISGKIIAFERDDYKGVEFPGEIVSLGKLIPGNYLNRLLQFLKVSLLIRKEIRSIPVVYAFGLDMAFLLRLSSIGLIIKPKLIYEIADIREILIQKSILGKIGRFIERWILKKTQLLIVTSKAYIDEYYKKILGGFNTNFMVIENKLDSHMLNKIIGIDKNEIQISRIRDVQIDVLKIGYFGRLRCNRSWEVLKYIAEKSNGGIEIVARGVNVCIDNFENDVNNIPNIKFLGEFRSPDDLREIYNDIDLVWAAHFHAQTNLKWARVCRFYEACYFKKPLISQIGTEDGRIVEKLGLGVCINLDDIKSSGEDVLKITRNTMEKWTTAINKLPAEISSYSNEHKNLPIN